MNLDRGGPYEGIVLVLGGPIFGGKRDNKTGTRRENALRVKAWLDKSLRTRNYSH